MGASLGAYHAANTLFKHPDAVRVCFAMSGLYDLRSFMDGLYDDNFYFNNPIDYIGGMTDPWQIGQISSARVHIATGTGPFEHPVALLRSVARAELQGHLPPPRRLGPARGPRLAVLETPDAGILEGDLAGDPTRRSLSRLAPSPDLPPRTVSRVFPAQAPLGLALCVTHDGVSPRRLSCPITRQQEVEDRESSPRWLHAFRLAAGIRRGRPVDGNAARPRHRRAGRHRARAFRSSRDRRRPGLERTAVSDSAGQYLLASLAPGLYQVEAKLSGFKPQAKEVELAVARTVSVDFQLGVGTVAEAVTVVAETPVIEASTISVGPGHQPAHGAGHPAQRAALRGSRAAHSRIR